MDTVIDLLRSYWPTVAGLLSIVAAALAAGHATLHKRDPKALAGWLAVILFAPLLGATLYLLIGINRIRRRVAPLGLLRAAPPAEHEPPVQLIEALDPEDRHLEALIHFTNQSMRRPLVGGNQLRPLADGDAAYPAMLAAIEAATRSITLCTYIFDDDTAGRRFIDALAAAKDRGVEVRVLIDAVGERYSLPKLAGRALSKRGVRVARFLPTLLPWRFTYAQLRMHKKALVVDGSLAFTGGMNIRSGNLLREQPANPVRDLQFRIEGPVTRQLQSSFAEDWLFTTREELTGERFFPAVEPTGEDFARAITDGPDRDLEHLKWAFMGGLACARRSVKIVTPYFIPDGVLIAALNSAAMRGVRVDIILPEECNLSLPEWASRATVWELLQHGCRIWLTPSPFDHAKLMVVDDAWTLIGSGNWDPRSFRLCFELMVECHGRSFAAQVAPLVEERLRSARELTFEEVEARPLLVKLRDGAARALSPYL